MKPRDVQSIFLSKCQRSRRSFIGTAVSPAKQGNRSYRRRETGALPGKVKKDSLDEWEGEFRERSPVRSVQWSVGALSEPQNKASWNEGRALKLQGPQR